MRRPTDAERGSPELEALLAQRDFVRGLARRLLADEHGAEDLAQSALVIGLRGPAPERDGARAYLAGVLRHLAHKERRGSPHRSSSKPSP